MQNYFRTLAATRATAIKPEMTKAQEMRVYKKALTRHHGISDEARYIVNTWIQGCKNYEEGK